MEESNKDRAFATLISNLKKFNRQIGWSQDHPLIQTYVSRMEDPVREYHGWGHLTHLLDEFLDFDSNNEQQLLLIRAAILFHDIVYVPGASDNEEKSALFAAEFYPKGSQKQIQSLIMATCHTFPFEKYGDDRDIICDLDLSILGAPKDKFFEYRLKVAQEYKGVYSPEEFDRGTREFFRKLFDQTTRDYIFRTEHFRDLYENTARENIKSILGL